MSLSIGRRVGWIAAATLAIAPLTLLASPASAAPPTLCVTSLAFATGHVDATTGAAVRLDWTVADRDATATSVSGDVYLAMRSTVTHRFLGRTYHARYAYQNSGPGQADYVSGTPRESSYSYLFAVPQYADASTAEWVVTKITVADSTGHSLALAGHQLDGYRETLTATELVDASAPAVGAITLDSNTYPVRPYYYVNGASADVRYELEAQDWQSGFWRGWLVLRGPGGQQVRADFAFSPDNNGFYDSPGCGYLYGNDDRDQLCGVIATLPAGAAAGTWSVSSVTVLNNAGVAATIGGSDGAPPVVATSDAVVSASGFTATPNPVNNWAQAQTVRVSMRVTGAQQGIAAIYVDTVGGASGGCPQTGTTPTADPDGTVSVPLQLYQGVAGCTVHGIAIVDGAGNVALYGQNYGAPDPGVRVKQVTDTPPVATGATLSVTSVPESQLAQTVLLLTVQLAPTVAPVTGIGFFLYDASGNQVTSGFGGTAQFPDGTVRWYQYLSGLTLPPGTYPVGFRLDDAARMSSLYGMPGSPPVPGGPLTLTVTDG
jgi:hypothetical protein